jgi:transcriptional regulator with XRE-family HTH domain
MAGVDGPGARLRQRRVELGRSIRSVAETIGLTHQQWAKIETGRNRIASDHLLAACRVLGISADEVLGLSSAEMAPSEVDQQARRLMQIFRDLPTADQRELMRVARLMARDATPIAA